MSALNNARHRLAVAGLLWRDRAQRARVRVRRGRHALVSSLLILAGLGGALAGGALVGEWALGLVLIAESGGVLWFGLFRDDGMALPQRGARTVQEVLEAERQRPDPAWPPPGPGAWNLP